MRGHRPAHQEADGDDEEFLAASTDFIDRATRAKKPFFVWFNPSRMHIWTWLKPDSQGKTGLGIYPDGMVEHDEQVGRLLLSIEQALEKLRLPPSNT